LLAGQDNTSGNLVTKNQRERMSGRDTVYSEADVGVTNATAGNLDDDLVDAGLKRRKRPAFKRLAHGK
jgi:hypothetical protein